MVDIIPKIENEIDYQMSADKDRNVFINRHHASSAGRCFKMLKYAWEHAPEKALDLNVKVKLLTGMLWHRVLASLQEENYLTEYKIDLPELEVSGFLDKAIVAVEKKTIFLYDLKTTASYVYSKRFGKNKSEKSGFQEMQLATYGLGLERRYPDYTIRAFIVWLIPETGKIKVEEIDYRKFRKTASMYWQDAMINTKLPHDQLVPGESFGVPFQSWECNYCAYSNICQTPFKAKEKSK